ncbi:MAG: UbiD family decarboxylase [Desulfobacterales bacterium]|nr:UbiD family decarboxylase [Desulfobacterales bacterium]
MKLSLRDWLEMAEAADALVRIDGADWDLEIGALSAISVKRKDCPALLFDAIKGYAPGYRVLTCSTSNHRLLSRTFNISACTSDMDLVKIFKEKIPQWEAALKEFPPRIVATGPVLENVLSGMDVDLLKFPAPKWHEHDNGRYIGTGDAVITRDPDTGAVNIGTYRIKVHDKKTAALFITPGKHGRLHYEKYHSRAERCPVAISIGHHPLLFRVAGIRTPEGCEYNYVGAVQGEPVRVIQEEITGLPIPADSEIVIVGWCPPDKKMPEGPFGEWTGYYASREEPTPIVEVERIYHRNRPIILGAPPSRPPHDAAYCRTIMGSALLYNELLKNGIPDIQGVWLSEAGLELLIIISLIQRYPGHARQAALFATQNRLSASLGRYVIVVDEDIDPSNIQEVLWAVCTRSDPEKDIDIVRRLWASSLDPIAPRSTRDYFSSRAIIDACKPFEWKDQFPREIQVSPELYRRVTDKWKDVLKLN